MRPATHRVARTRIAHHTDAQPDRALHGESRLLSRDSRLRVPRASVLAELTPRFAAYLDARRDNRLLSQRFPVEGLELRGEIEDCAAALVQNDTDPGGAGESLEGHRHDYFGDSLGAAFLYQRS